MQFCSNHSKDLEAAFASLSFDSPSSSDDAARNPLAPAPRPVTPSPPKLSASIHAPSGATPPSSPAPEAELPKILLALRKLREGLLATSHQPTFSPVFSQRVHIFGIQVGILARYPPTYYHSLLYLLFTLHKPKHPLAQPELAEMTTYLILDMACRQNNVAGAYALRARSRRQFKYESRVVDSVLAALVRDNWVEFWRARRTIDGYMRAVVDWAIDGVRRQSLKCLGRAYLGCDVDWVLESATGGSMLWEELVRKESVGWIREGDRVTIRKIKAKPAEETVKG